MLRASPLLALVACTGTARPDTHGGSTPPKGPQELARVSGFATPEGVRCVGAGACVVSNVSGQPSVQDGDGFLSRISVDGALTTLAWSEGTLDGPKGMDRVGETLYVADIQEIRAVDLGTGAVTAAAAVDGAGFLNDLAVAPDGSLWFTDTQRGTLHRWDRSGAVETVVADLAGPNGVLVHDDRVWVASFGEPTLWAHDLAGTLQGTYTLPAGQLDGVVVDRDGRFLVSSWAAEGVFAGTPGGDWTLLLEGLPGPADLGYDADTHRLFVPLFNDGQVVVFTL